MENIKADDIPKLMIDRIARDDHAQKLRWLASGRICNWQYEDNIPDSGDSAVYRVYQIGGWHLYNDTSEYRLTGKRALGRVTRRSVARWILFLKSDLPYQYPPSGATVFFKYCASFFTFGFAFRTFRRERKRKYQDWWPFDSQEQLDSAVHRTL